MWLDGSNKFSIPKKVEGVDKGKNFILTDLAIDIKYKRLYWATSSQSNQIQTCDYDGEDFKTLRSEPGTDSLVCPISETSFLSFQSPTRSNIAIIVILHCFNISASTDSSYGGSEWECFPTKADGQWDGGALL